MKLRTHLKSLLTSSLLVTLCVTQAGALEYNVDAPEDYLFGRPTSQESVYQQEDQNVNRSKTAALIAPGFGSPASYLPGLTSNPAPGGMDDSLVNSLGNMDYTTLSDVDSRYKDGSLGTLHIPAIGLTAKVVQGTDSAALAEGVGHFPDTSIWNGNICLAAHNRGINSYFGKIHMLSIGDSITLTTKEGTRTYSVTSVEKVSETDTSGTAATSDNRITFYTCVRNEREYRWCVKGVEV